MFVKIGDFILNFGPQARTSVCLSLVGRFGPPKLTFDALPPRAVSSTTPPPWRHPSPLHTHDPSRIPQGLPPPPRLTRKEKNRNTHKGRGRDTDTDKENRTREDCRAKGAITNKKGQRGAQERWIIQWTEEKSPLQASEIKQECREQTIKMPNTS